MPGLRDFNGQLAIKELIASKMDFARQRGIALPHLLFCGDKELGKRTLAAAIAHDMGVPFFSTSADTLIHRIDLSGLITNIRPGEIFTISDIEAIRSEVSNTLVDLIAEFKFTIMLGAGPGAKEHSIRMPQFTFIGTTSRPWMVDERIRRWCIPCNFAPYTEREATEIVLRIARDKGLPLDIEAASDIAAQSGHRPGEAKVFLQRIANHFRFDAADRLDRSRLLELREYFGEGRLYPELLNVAEQLRGMDGVEFEHWVADLFRRAGFLVNVTKVSGDHGIDLLASLPGRLIAVQCKRWDGTVGEPIVRDLYGAMTAVNAHSGCLVTTGSFTAQAHQFAKGKPLSLLDFDSVMEAVRSPNVLRQWFNHA